jgi:DNA-binding MarR family transcriptional regulator
MTTPKPMLNGAILAQAERASRAVLDRLLARSGTSFHHYLALTVTAGQGGTVERDTLVDRMVAGLKLDPAIIRADIESAETAGLLRTEGAQTSLTDAGRARYARITTATDEVTARLYADLPTVDLEVAGRMLTILTERANAELANR